MKILRFMNRFFFQTYDKLYQGTGKVSYNQMNQSKLGIKTGLSPVPFSKSNGVY